MPNICVCRSYLLSSTKSVVKIQEMSSMYLCIKALKLPNGTYCFNQKTFFTAVIFKLFLSRILKMLWMKYTYIYRLWTLYVNETFLNECHIRFIRFWSIQINTPQKTFVCNQNFNNYHFEFALRPATISEK